MNVKEIEVLNLGQATLVGHFENGSPEWLQAREGVGGSDIGTICGVNNFKTREQLLTEKLDPHFRPEPPSLPMRLGTEFESGIRKLWAEQNSNWLTVYGTGTWQSTKNNAFKANPDGLICWNNDDLGILEIKYSQARELPQSWVYQVNWYLAVLGLQRGIVVQCSGNKFIEHPIVRDQELVSVMFNEAEKYLNEMETRRNAIFFFLFLYLITIRFFTRLKAIPSAVRAAATRSSPAAAASVKCE